jgi:hypothetical protein
MADDKSDILSEVCDALTDNQLAVARDILRDRYPFVPAANVGRRYTFRQMIAVFLRDGFVDRYSGARLVFPATLRLISKLLPEQFPFHRNGRLDVCHFAFWELFPTIDHLVPVAREIRVHSRRTRLVASSTRQRRRVGWADRVVCRAREGRSVGPGRPLPSAMVCGGNSAWMASVSGIHPGRSPGMQFVG